MRLRRYTQQMSMNTGFKHCLLTQMQVFERHIADVLLVYFPLIDVEDVGDETEAMSKVECPRPSIVFLDTQLPGGNGLIVLITIRQIYNDMVMVKLPDNNLPEHRQQDFENGADQYIS